MHAPLILASSSTIRAQLLTQAGLAPGIVPPRIDEQSLRAAMQSEAMTPRDMADALADAKARKISARHPDSFVLGCDQIAALSNDVLTKPRDKEAARQQLARLSGRGHQLYSAAVLYRIGQPLWRHVGKVTLTFHTLSPAFIDSYVQRNWPSIRHAVGAYKLEEEGVRLISALDGDYFHVLGLPLIELMSYLVHRGDLEI